MKSHSNLLGLLVVAALSACGGGGADAPSGTAAQDARAVTSDGVTATLALQSDWTAGYCANVVLANTSTSPVTSWTVVIDLNQSTLSNAWGASTTASGTQITAKPLDYTASIAPGASVSFGFCGSATGSNYHPTVTSLSVVGGGTGTSYTLTAQRAGSGSGTVSSSPAGIACGTTCSASFPSGTVVTLTATPASGSRFAGWSGACSGTAACTVTMSAAQAVTATFDPSTVTTYDLTVTKSGTGGGAVTSSPAGIDCGSTCAASYASGTAVTLTATAATGSTFAGWSGACTGTGACVVTMTAAQAAAAAFNANPTGSAVSISAGGAASGTFVADTDYSGGSTYSTTATIDTSLVPSPVPPQSVLQHERYGTFTYTIPGLAAGSPYTVTLYFVESYWSAAGQRTFNVAINGSPALTAFDIFAAAGATNKAVARTFNATASASGQVVIAFSAGTADNPKVDGLTVAPGTATINYTLTVSKTGSGTVTGTGISCGTSCSAVFASGTTVTLTAAATSPATFGGWGGACTGTSTTCAVSMTADRAVTATFSGGGTGGSAGCGKAPGISSSQYNNGSHISITAGGMQRRYILNVPTNYDNSHPYRLVIAYHELNGNDDEMYRNQYYHLLNLSNNSTIFVAPNGQQNGASCTQASGCGWPNTNNSDLALADAVVAQVAQNFCVDMSRIFVTGWSYGGSMSYKTSCERPQGGTASWYVRGAAVYSGAQLSGTCTPSKPVAYYASHGTGDSVLSYDTGLGLFQNFAKANGCTYVTPTKVTSGNHVCTTLSGCKSGYTTEWCSFNGGHTPDPSDGGTSWEYQNVWSFLSQF